MTIDEMIEILEEYRERFGGATEVRMMMQGPLPLEYKIEGVASGAEINEQIAADETLGDASDY